MTNVTCGGSQTSCSHCNGFLAGWSGNSCNVFKGHCIDGNCTKGDFSQCVTEAVQTCDLGCQKPECRTSSGTQSQFIANADTTRLDQVCKISGESCGGAMACTATGRCAMTTGAVAGIVVGAIVALLAIVGVVLLVVRRNRRAPQMARSSQSSKQNAPVPNVYQYVPEASEFVIPRVQEPVPPPQPSSRSTKLWQIDPDDIQKLDYLGGGHFGDVFKGMWQGKIDVALKVVKGEGNARVVASRDFEFEVERMSQISLHPHVVPLYGITTLADGALAAVVEFCPLGALIDTLYVTRQRGDTDDAIAEKQARLRKWKPTELIGIAHDAACGVAHLHDNKIVHRDLAARNILLAGDSKKVVAKVADFGMARALDNGENARTTVAGTCPIRWMAPEQLEHRIYSAKSDVYAYGVVLFELYARAIPWAGMTNEKVAQLVLAGSQLEPAGGTPEPIKRLMSRCFECDPDERITMKKVCKELLRVQPEELEQTQ
jgi:hypothetical protein